MVVFREAAVITRMRIVTVVFAGLLAGCSSQPDAMGSYVTSDGESVMMVRLTSVSDGQVSGTISVVATDEEGKNQAGTRPLYGTIEGNALNLSIEGGNGVAMATGTIEDENLHLTMFGNGGSTRLTLAKSDTEEFNELANTSRVRAAEKKHEIESVAALRGEVEQRSKSQKAIDAFADSTFANASEVLEKSRKIEVVIAGYRATRDRTGRMQTAKRGIDAQSYEGSYRVSQIDYQIDSLSNGMETTHAEVRTYMQNLRDRMGEATSKSAQHLAECQADQMLNCARLAASMITLQTRYQQFRRDYARENAAFGQSDNDSA